MYTRLTWATCLLGLSLLPGPAGLAAEEVEAAVGPPESPAETPSGYCREPAADDDEWIDSVQRGVYTGVCGAAVWFDGLFGNPRYDQDSNDTFGRIGLYETLDRRDNLDTRLKFRARLALPAFENRARITLGRGDEQQLVEDRPANSENPQPAAFRSDTDDAWLLGLGYGRQDQLERGFDFGIGVRLRFPVDPYVRASYRHNFIFNDRNMLRFRETPFWRDSRGFGATTQLAFDHLVGPRLLLRWNNVGTIAEDTDGLDWGTGVTAFHSLGSRRAISYTALMRGETDADVSLQNYGAEVRYRQQVFRRWLFIELLTSLTWPRETLEEKREINPGIGVGFEMFFGPTPDSQLR
ncbi:MAG: hypothetical protein QG595_2032 [Pseudomonadota bacterium]|jgi:hypothetical protein|nr:hypothetical protein [Pseudomonadota bacterium]